MSDARNVTNTVKEAHAEWLEAETARKLAASEMHKRYAAVRDLAREQAAHKAGDVITCGDMGHTWHIIDVNVTIGSAVVLLTGYTARKVLRRGRLSQMRYEIYLQTDGTLKPSKYGQR